MPKKWKVIEDRQGGTWCVGISQTATEWLDNVCEWLRFDGAFDEVYTEEKYRNYWQGVISKDPQKFIDYVDDFWFITMKEE